MSARLTNEQQRVLKAVAEGRLIRNHDMGWFQKPGYRVQGERNARDATVSKLIQLQLIRPVAAKSGTGYTVYELVPHPPQEDRS